MGLRDGLEKCIAQMPMGSTHQMSITTVTKIGEQTTGNFLKIIRENFDPYTDNLLNIFHHKAQVLNYVSPAKYVKIQLVQAGNSTDLDIGTIGAYLGMLDKVGHAKTTYRNALEDIIFRTLYNYEERDITYVENNIVVTKKVMSGPCMRCGLLLPWPYLTIDHQESQSRGEWTAILKAFRACGLTAEGPKGHKGRNLLAHLSTGKPLSTIPTKLNRASITSNDDLRNTLTDMGSVVYTLVKAANLAEQFKVACMNSLMNLAPMCLYCNSSKNNK